MLVADSVTAAVEVSIYLASEAISHMQQKPDFHLPLNATAILTRHIDVLQVRNGRIHILDYPSDIWEVPSVFNSLSLEKLNFQIFELVFKISER
jgi:hypothetical protein